MSLVLYLQSDAIDPEMPVSDLLRRAKVLATKLGVRNALIWIDKELNGHPEGVKANPPLYRVTRGFPVYLDSSHGWCRLPLRNHKMLEMISTAKFYSSLAGLESLLADNAGNDLYFDYDQFFSKAETFIFDMYLINKFGLETRNISLIVTSSQVCMIVDAVRNLVLHWTLELERCGVFGEGMSFTLKERETAILVTYNYFDAHNIGVAGDVSGQARIRNWQE